MTPGLEVGSGGNFRQVLREEDLSQIEGSSDLTNRPSGTNLRKNISRSVASLPSSCDANAIVECNTRHFVFQWLCYIALYTAESAVENSLSNDSLYVNCNRIMQDESNTV